MALYQRFLFIACAAFLVVLSCTKPVLIGSDFLEDEKASLNFLDTFDLSFFTERTDSILVHSDFSSRQLTTYLLGDVTDPIFGHYRAEIFAQPLLPTISTALKDATIDSVILQLKYDSLGNYGNLNTPVTIEVYRMIERPDFKTEYYSDQRFMTSPDILGSLTLVPKPKDSVTIITSGDTVTVAPHIRIPLSIQMLGGFTTQDSSVYSHIDSFLNFFNGLHIRMTGAGNTMIGLDLLDITSRLSFFYDKDASLDQELKFVFTPASVKTVYMEHDYTGSFVAPSLNAEPENDYWFVQGMSGLTTKMIINDLNKLENVIINQAELEVFCTFPPGDNPNLYPPGKYLVTQDKTDTSITNSLDVLIALANSSGNPASTIYKTLYGGVLERVESGPPAVYRYNMKVTAQVKDIFQGKKENIIYFNPFDKGNVPNRSVMFGPGHPKYAPRLRIYYTAL
ncbi:MAG: DUF4270 family protein [Saprospiraceae bacterium]